MLGILNAFCCLCIEPFPPFCRKMATNQTRLSGSVLRGLDTQVQSRVNSKIVYLSPSQSTRQADNQVEVPNRKQAWRSKRKTSLKTSQEHTKNNTAITSQSGTERKRNTAYVHQEVVRKQWDTGGTNHACGNVWQKDKNKDEKLDKIETHPQLVRIQINMRKSYTVTKTNFKIFPYAPKVSIRINTDCNMHLIVNCFENYPNLSWYGWESF